MASQQLGLQCGSLARALVGRCHNRSGLVKQVPLGLAPCRALASTATSEGCDVAIIGGGVIGSSVALHLAVAAPTLRIAVFEGDATYTRASAPRSAGGIRQQFSLRTNVELSIYGADFLKSGLRKMCADVDVDTDVQLRENGYLLLATPGEGEETLRENVEVPHAAGADWIRVLGPEALRDRFPWLSTDGVALGAFGERNEGYFDPWALLQAMRKGAIARGVAYVQQNVTGLMLGGAEGGIRSLELADGTSVKVGTVVNAAGAQGGHIVGMCGPDVTPLPVVPRKRCMWLFKAQEMPRGPPLPPENTPLTIDSSGVYFRSEGSAKGTFVCGVSPTAEEDIDLDASDPRHLDHLDTVDDDLFHERIWPALATRAPALEALRVESSWAGFYEYNTLDQNGVVGWHPDIPNMLVACGFSGHGLQQSPGVGRSCAELVVHGAFTTVDLSCFGYQRILRQEPIFERGIY